MLEVHHIFKTYEGKGLLNDISFTVSTGETICLLGASGSGKSTLMAALAWPEAGEEIVPARFVQALAFVSLAPSPPELARFVAEQLHRTVDGFTDATVQVRNSEAHRCGLPMRGRRRLPATVAEEAGKPV